MELETRRHTTLIITGDYEAYEKISREHHAVKPISGHYNPVTGIHQIWTFKQDIEQLRALGYRDLEFCNGGDDDILCIDHARKEYGFFEDHLPKLTHIAKAKTLQELYHL